MTFTARQAHDTTQHTTPPFPPAPYASSARQPCLGVQEALARGALSEADVLLWLRVRGRPVIGWVCQHWPAFRRALAPCHALPWVVVLSGSYFRWLVPSALACVQWRAHALFCRSRACGMYLSVKAVGWLCTSSGLPSSMC